jgi:hypothetical protein
MKVCVLAHIYVHVYVCVEETEQENNWILLRLVEHPLLIPENHSEEELSARPEVQTDPRPNSCLSVYFPAGSNTAMADPESSCLCLANRDSRTR